MGLGLLVRIEAAKNQLLLWDQLIARDNSGAVAAEDNGFGLLSKDFAVDVTANQHDGDFFLNASRMARGCERHWGPTCQKFKLSPLASC